MCNRYFGCLLLVWFPAVLHAQSETQSCSAPELLGGVFAPRQRTYTSGTVVTYICNEGLKPAVKGRLATITCENGEWSDRAQCIDVKACIPPSIPNGHYTENSNGWYEEGYTMRTECDQGYEHRGSLAVTRCVAGDWTSLPICEKSATACGQPPTFPHALMFDQGYKEVFPAETQVLYVCEDGYAAEGGHPATPVLCIDGDWTKGPTCSKESISVSKCGTHPTIEHGDIVEVDAMFLRIRCNASYSLVGPEKVVCYTDGTWSQLPICQETSTTSDKSYRTIDDCGSPQNLPNTRYTVAKDRMSLTYKCLLRYSLTGSPTVRCNSDRTWSHLPTCRDCVAPLGQYTGGLYLNENKVIEEGRTTKVQCSSPGLIGRIFCRNGWIHHTACCTEDALHSGNCPVYILPEPA